MLLKDKVAVVTGAARGIGKRVAETLAEQGAKIAILDINEELAAETADSINQKGADTFVAKVDVSNLEECRKIIADIIEKFDRIDVLVNNAGITRDKALYAMGREDWQSVIDVNLTGVFNFCRSVIFTMLKQKSGAIVNMSSISGIFGTPGQVNYSASKAGIIGITKALAKEAAKANVRINAVAPGFIKTAMTEKLPEKYVEEMKKVIPLKDFGEIEDVAELVTFLASDKAKYITGEVIRVDGGLAM